MLGADIGRRDTAQWRLGYVTVAWTTRLLRRVARATVRRRVRAPVRRAVPRAPRTAQLWR